MDSLIAISGPLSLPLTNLRKADSQMGSSACSFVSNKVCHRGILAVDHERCATHAQEEADGQDPVLYSVLLRLCAGSAFLLPQPRFH